MSSNNVEMWLAKGADAKELGQREYAGILTGRRWTGEDGCLDPNVLLLSQPPRVVQVLSESKAPFNNESINTMPRNSALQQPSTAKGSPRVGEATNTSRLSSYHAKKSSHGSPPASSRLQEHGIQSS